MNTKEKQPPKRIKFTADEDNLLVQCVSKFKGKKPNWKRIAYILNKTPKQCRERYRTYLTPEVANTQWTKEDDDKLRELVNTIGKSWAKLRQYFPGKSDNAIKNRYNFHINPIRKIQQQSKLNEITLELPNEYDTLESLDSLELEFEPFSQNQINFDFL